MLVFRTVEHLCSKFLHHPHLSCASLFCSFVHMSYIPFGGNLTRSSASGAHQWYFNPLQANEIHRIHINHMDLGCPVQ